MAASVITVTVAEAWLDERMLNVVGTLGVAAGDYATGGNTVDFSGLVKASRAPVEFEVKNFAGYQPVGIIGTLISNCKLQIFQGDNPNVAAAPGVELAAGVMPAGVTGATIRFRATFKKNL